jgi:hypothetical protein
MSTQPPPVQVYISYHDDDEPWVQQELVPRLNKAGVLHIDEGNFLPQIPELTRIQQSVVKCRYSLLVITPNYLADNFHNFEIVLLIQYGLDRNRVLTIPVIKDSGQGLPVLLSFPLRVNVLADGAWEGVLLAAINKEPPAPADLTDAAYVNARKAHESQPKISAGLAALIELMKIKEVKLAVRAFHADFEEASNQIKILADYKTMHDLLHGLESGPYLLLKDAERFNASSNLILYEGLLQVLVEKIQKIAREETFAQYVTDWLRNLEDALDFLHQTNEGNNKSLTKSETLSRSIWNLAIVLGRAPSSVNDRLMEAARRLRLSALVYAMLGVRAELQRQEIDGERLEQFVSGIGHLADFYYRLETLKKEHDRWQNIDNHLRRIQGNFDAKPNDLFELENSWPQLSDLSLTVYAGRSEKWATQMSVQAEIISVALQERNISNATGAFQRFKALAYSQFSRVDTALLSVCEELRLVGKSLSAVVEVLETFTYD